MTTPEGEAPPRGGFAAIVSELLVTDIATSLSFWTGVLGFAVAYRRRDQGFAYLQHADGAQIMLCRRSGLWETAQMQPPFGRGVMFQIHVHDLSEVLRRIAETGWPVHTAEREVWRDYGDRMGGRREIAVQDPDGYLVLVAQHIGERPLDA